MNHSSGPSIPGSGGGVTVGTFTLKSTLFTEAQAEELEKSMKIGFEEVKEGIQKLAEGNFEGMKASMKTNFDDMKKDMKEGLEKFSEEKLKTSMNALKNDMKESMKNALDEMKSIMKTDFEGLKKEVKDDLKKLTKEVFDRDHYQKKLQFLEKENARLKAKQPRELNEESFDISNSKSINYLDSKIPNK